MTKFYFSLTLETLTELAAEKGLRFVYHPVNGCSFYDSYREVGWSEPDRRKIAEFIDKWPYGEEDAPMDPKVALELVREHFLDQTWVDGDISKAMMVLGVAVESYTAQLAAFKAGLDVELADVGMGHVEVRLWRDGAIVAERSEKAGSGAILAKLLDELKKEGEIQ